MKTETNTFETLRLALRQQVAHLNGSEVIHHRSKFYWATATRVITLHNQIHTCTDNEKCALVLNSWNWQKLYRLVVFLFQFYLDNVDICLRNLFFSYLTCQLSRAQFDTHPLRFFFALLGIFIFFCFVVIRI